MKNIFKKNVKKSICGILSGILFVSGISCVDIYANQPNETVFHDAAQDISNEIASIDADPVTQNKASVEEIEAIIDTLEDVDVINTEEQIVSEECAMETIDTEEKQDVEKQIVNEENEDYIIETYEEDGKQFVATYSQDLSTMSLVCCDGDIITNRVFLYDSTLQKYLEQTVVLETDETMTLTDENNVEAQKINYNSKTKTLYNWNKNPYYYQSGSSKEKTYLKIGCKANYRIRTDNLSDKKAKKCNAYKSAIKKSNSYYQKGTAYLAGSSVTLGVVLGLVVANVAFPPSVIATMAVGALGGGSAVYKGASALANSQEKFCDAKDYYAIIKTYGKKL